MEDLFSVVFWGFLSILFPLQLSVLQKFLGILYWIEYLEGSGLQNMGIMLISTLFKLALHLGGAALRLLCQLDHCDFSPVSKDSILSVPYSVEVGSRLLSFPETLDRQNLAPITFALWCYSCDQGKRDFADIIKLIPFMALKSGYYPELSGWTYHMSPKKQRSFLSFVIGGKVRDLEMRILDLNEI